MNFARLGCTSIVVGSTALPEQDTKILNFDTARTPQERDIDYRSRQPNAPRSQVTLGRPQGVERPVRWIRKTGAWYPLGLSCKH